MLVSGIDWIEWPAQYIATENLEDTNLNESKLLKIVGYIGPELKKNSKSYAGIQFKYCGF